MCFVVQKSLLLLCYFCLNCFLDSLTSLLKPRSNLTISLPMLRSSVKSEKRQCHVRMTSEYRSEA